MKKIFLIAIMLSCISIIVYSQRKETKIFVKENRAALDTMYVFKTPLEIYGSLNRDTEGYSRTLNKKWGKSTPMEFVWDGIAKKDRLLLQSETFAR